MTVNGQAHLLDRYPVSANSSPLEERKAAREQKLLRELGVDLEALMRDPSIREVMVNPCGQVFVDHAERGLEPAGVSLRPLRMKAIVGTIAAIFDTVITGESPMVQGELALLEGRIEALRSPVVSAPCFSFRKKASKVFSLDDYVESGRLDDRSRAVIAELIRRRKNILVVGGTGTGKTTFINALLLELAEQEPSTRVVLIQDTKELQCPVKNKVELMAVEGVASMNRLLRTTLRLRPDRIIVGEVRGSEALTLLKAWNTGHPGGFASLHANGTSAALRRLELLVQEGCGRRLQELVGEVVDVVIHLEHGARVTSIVSVHGFGEGEYRRRKLWEA